MSIPSDKEIKRWMTHGVRSEVFASVMKERPHFRGAEIGVMRGDNSSELLRLLPDLHLVCVDSWKTYPGYKKDFSPQQWQQVVKTFRRNVEPYKDRVTVIRKFSVDAVEDVEDESLDFVYIDANHKYEYAKENIEIWTPKVKPGGIVAGHDYGLEKIPKWSKRGWNVTQAVDEAFPSVNVEDCWIWWAVKDG